MNGILSQDTVFNDSVVIKEEPRDDDIDNDCVSSIFHLLRLFERILCIVVF